MHPDTSRMDHSSSLPLTNGGMGLSLLNSYHPQLHLREEAPFSLDHSNPTVNYDGDAEDMIETIVIEVFKCKECRFYTSEKITVLEHVRQVHCARSMQQVGSPEGSEVNSEIDCNPMDLSAKTHAVDKTSDKEASTHSMPVQKNSSVTSQGSTIGETTLQLQGEVSKEAQDQKILQFPEVKIKKEREDCSSPCGCMQTSQEGCSRGGLQPQNASMPAVNRPTSLNDSLRSIKTEPQDEMELCRINKWPFVSYEPVRKDVAMSPTQPPSGKQSPADSEPQMSPDSSQDQPRRAHLSSAGSDSPPRGKYSPHYNSSEHSGNDSEVDVPSSEEDMDVFCLAGNSAVIPGLPVRLDTMSESSLPQFHPVLRKELEKHHGMAALRTREGFVKKIHLMHMVQKDASKGGASDDVVPRIARTVSMATDAAMEENQSETQQTDSGEWLTKETSWIEYKCPKCDRRSFKTAEDLDFHLKCHSDQGGYKCIYCGHATNIWSTLKQHVYSKHCLDKPFKCQHCSYQAASKQLLKAHRLRHLSVGGDRVSKDYTCSICNFTCSWGPGFLQHMKVHGGLKSCFHCGFVTSNSAVLYRHIVKNHNSSKPNKCPECPFTSSNANLLALHANKHASPGKESASETTKVAPGCKNVIRYSKYICQICGDSYEGQQELIQHVVTSHPGKQLLFCEQCKYTTRRRDHMEKHLQSGVTADIADVGCAMKCKLCGRIDQDREAMEAHIRTAHLSELQSVEALIQGANTASNNPEMAAQNIKSVAETATTVATSYTSGNTTSPSPSLTTASPEDAYQSLQVTASRETGNGGTLMTFRSAKPTPPALTPVIGGMPYYSVQLRDRSNSEPGNDFHGFLKFKVNKETKQRLKQAAKTRQKEQPEDFANMQMKFKLQGAGHRRRGRKPGQGFQKLVQEDLF
ncbi:zinc finger protein 629-like [Branchiostoma lanceolatum]|uniref:zinc finger protein 629-like n=1 Tax=Branchiostoma lanceolatum TaxID=7740 RepID=UPI0034566880